MGGSSKKKVSDTTTTPTQPIMATFGQSGVSPDVMSQLAAGGLMSVAQPSDMYQTFQVPILRTPSDLDGYLLSIGKKPATADTINKTSKASTQPSGLQSSTRREDGVR